MLTPTNAVLAKNARRILALVAKDSGVCHCGTIAQKLNLTIETVRRHVNVLGQHGLIVVRCVGTRISEHAIEGTAVLLGNGFVAWTHQGVPTRQWCEEGSTDRIPSSNYYSISMTADGGKAL
ncbi:MAG: ArsR family transcriptional regulator [Desulfurellales bacterium]|nr:MAG: ArsR family transcriptional regulator [Desulfurellales bacterium]